MGNVSKFAAVFEARNRIDEQPEPQSNETQVTPATPVSGVSGVIPASEDVAPKRDFTRVANSIVREAVPAGAFTGKGKQLYDYLYSQTRGAIVPKMSARLRTERVIKAAGMSRPTYKAHLARLVAWGLINVEEKVGEHGGNIFTVYLPEEIDNSSKWGNSSKPTNSTQELEGQLGKETYSGNSSLSNYQSTTSATPKTFSKTKKEFDDEAAAVCREFANELAQTLSGREAKLTDYSTLKEMFDVILIEARIAGDRTSVVSSPAAFIAEHLRRRLFKKGKVQMEAESSEATAATPANLDTRECPDCRGHIWWYPDGQDKGVARCSHPKL